MLFLQIDSAAPVSSYLSGEIKAALAAGKKVLWLVPGGSAMDIAVETAHELKGNPHLSNLTVSLTDERFGKPNHNHSNWRQLEKKGFTLAGAKKIDVLGEEGLEKTAQKYAAALVSALGESGYTLALAGMGADGHILGIKPRSQAVDAPQVAVGYKAEDFERVTATGELVTRLDEIVLYIVGKEKWPQIDKLSEELPANEQPAQLLKKARKVTIFNDYKEGSA